MVTSRDGRQVKAVRRGIRSRTRRPASQPACVALDQSSERGEHGATNRHAP